MAPTPQKIIYNVNSWEELERTRYQHIQNMSIRLEALSSSGSVNFI